MRIIAAYLARSIDVVDNLGYVLGGGLTTLVREVYPTALGTDVFMMLELGPDEGGGLPIEVNLRNVDDGASVDTLLFSGNLQESDSAAIQSFFTVSAALPTTGAPVPRPGQFAIVIQIGDLEAWPVLFRAGVPADFERGI